MVHEECWVSLPGLVACSVGCAAKLEADGSSQEQDSHNATVGQDVILCQPAGPFAPAEAVEALDMPIPFGPSKPAATNLSNNAAGASASRKKRPRNPSRNNTNDVTNAAFNNDGCKDLPSQAVVLFYLSPTITPATKIWKNDVRKQRSTYTKEHIPGKRKDMAKALDANVDDIKFVLEIPDNDALSMLYEGEVVYKRKHGTSKDIRFFKLATDEQILEELWGRTHQQKESKKKKRKMRRMPANATTSRSNVANDVRTSPESPIKQAGNAYSASMTENSAEQRLDAETSKSSQEENRQLPFESPNRQMISTKLPMDPRIVACQSPIDFLQMVDDDGPADECLVRLQSSKVNFEGSVDEWAKDWAKRLARGNHQAKSLKKDKNFCLSLLYRLCDRCIEGTYQRDPEVERTISQQDLVSELGTRVVERILTFCLPLSRADALYRNWLPGEDGPGIHWYSQRDCENVSWQQTMDKYPGKKSSRYLGKPTIDKRLVWLMEIEEFKQPAFLGWMRPEIAPCLKQKAFPIAKGKAIESSYGSYVT